MILQIFAVRDVKTDQYATPMFMHRTGEAIRGFADAINSDEKNNLLQKHAEDYELFHLGEFDTTTGVITSQQPKSIVHATQLKTRPEVI